MDLFAELFNSSAFLLHVELSSEVIGLPKLLAWAMCSSSSCRVMGFTTVKL
jgi:hypothetical protein